MGDLSIEGSDRMMRQTAGLFMDAIDEKAWSIDPDGMPEIVCFHGPYINQRIVREVYGDIPKDQIVLHATPTTHHDQHWDHPGKSVRISPTDVKMILNLSEEIQNNSAFVMNGNLKMRAESNGFLASQNNSAYYINDEGERLLKKMGGRVQVGDIKTLCEQLDIPEQAGMEFLRRLVTFGLYRAV